MTDEHNAYGEPPQLETRVLRYACVICDKLFDTKGATMEHIGANHIATIIRQYVRPTYREK